MISAEPSAHPGTEADSPLPCDELRPSAGNAVVPSISCWAPVPLTSHWNLQSSLHFQTLTRPLREVPWLCSLPLPTVAPDPVASVPPSLPSFL